MVKKIFYLIVLLYSTSLISQSSDIKVINGYVKDSLSGEILIGVDVVNHTLLEATNTNEFGFYSLEVSYFPTKMEVSYIGYKPKTIILTEESGSSLNIFLEPERNELSTVVLSAKKKDANVTGIQMSVIDLNLKQVKELPSAVGIADIIKALEYLPGVSSAREGANGFNVRGGNVDQNLIIIDDAHIYNSSHLLGFFSVINNDAIQNATLYKGGIPAEYGGRLSSVLDIRQKDGNYKKFKAKGGLGLIASQIMVEGPLVEDVSSFMIAGRRSYVDLFTSLSSSETLQNSSLYFYDLNMKLNYIIDDKNKLFVSGYLGRDAFGFDNRFGISWGNSNIGIRFNHVFTPKLFSNLAYSFSNYDYAIEIKPKGSEFEISSGIINHSLKYKFTYYLNNDNTMKFGAESFSYTFEPGDLKPLSSTSQIKSQIIPNKYAFQIDFYASNKWKVSEDVGIEYGFRYSNFARVGSENIAQYVDNKPNKWNGWNYEDNFLYSDPSTSTVQTKDYGTGELMSYFYGLEPRLLVSYNYNKLWSIKLGYNRNYQYMHLISNSISPTPTSIWLPAGPNIKPQYADQVSLGYFQNFFDDEVEFSIETFYKQFYQVIDYKDFADIQINKNVETQMLNAEGRAYGLEFSLAKKAGDFTGQLSYTLSNSERRTIGEGNGINFNNWYVAPFNKTHDFSTNVSYSFNSSLSLSSSFVFASGLPYTLPVQAYKYGRNLATHYTGDRGRDNLEPYHRMDIAMTYHFDKEQNDWLNHEIILSVYNLYDRYNAASLSFKKPETIEGATSNSNSLQAVKFTYFGIIPTITWNFKF